MTLPVIQRRRIEAELLKEIYDTLTQRFSQKMAASVIAESVRRSAIGQARQFAESEPGGTSLETFAELYNHWPAKDALVIEVKRRDAEAFDSDVKQCKYAERYCAISLSECAEFERL